MRKVRTHVFNGVKYDINIRDYLVDGLCDSPREKIRRPCISISTPYEKGMLTALIHEALHAENWAATEGVVRRTADEIGDFLWRLGYRRGTPTP